MQHPLTLAHPPPTITHNLINNAKRNRGRTKQANTELLQQHLTPYNIFLAQLITARSLDAMHSACITHHTTKHPRIDPRPEQRITPRVARYSDAPNLPRHSPTRPLPTHNGQGQPSLATTHKHGVQPFPFKHLATPTLLRQQSSIPLHIGSQQTTSPHPTQRAPKPQCEILREHLPTAKIISKDKIYRSQTLYTSTHTS